MSQFDPVIGADKTGLQYRTDDNAGKKALLNHHKGSTAPTYAEAGITWLDDSGTPWLLKVYDGTDWITMGSVNATSNAFTPFFGAAALQAASTTVAGLVERATDGEASAGTDTTRYITPKQLADNAGAAEVASFEVTTDVATIDFDSVFEAGKSYEIIIENLYPEVSGDGSNLEMLFSTDGGASYLGSGDYSQACITTGSTATSVTDNNVNGGARIDLTSAGIGANATQSEALSGTIRIYDPMDSEDVHITGHVSYITAGGVQTIDVLSAVAGVVASTKPQVDSVRFTLSTANDITHGKIIIKEI